MALTPTSGRELPVPICGTTSRWKSCAGRRNSGIDRWRPARRGASGPGGTSPPIGSGAQAFGEARDPRPVAAEILSLPGDATLRNPQGPLRVVADEALTELV